MSSQPQRRGGGQKEALSSTQTASTNISSRCSECCKIMLLVCQSTGSIVGTACQDYSATHCHNLRKLQVHSLEELRSLVQHHSTIKGKKNNNCDDNDNNNDALKAGSVLQVVIPCAARHASQVAANRCDQEAELHCQNNEDKNINSVPNDSEMFHNSKIPATPSISTIFDNQNPESSQQNSNISQEKSDTVMQQLSKTFQEVLSVGIKSKFGNTEMLKAPEESNIPFDDNRQSKYKESVCNINEDPKTPVIYSNMTINCIEDLEKLISTSLPKAPDYKIDFPLEVTLCCSPIHMDQLIATTGILLSLCELSTHIRRDNLLEQATFSFSDQSLRFVEQAMRIQTSIYSLQIDIPDSIESASKLELLCICIFPNNSEKSTASKSAKKHRQLTQKLQDLSAKYFVAHSYLAKSINEGYHLPDTILIDQLFQLVNRSMD